MEFSIRERTCCTNHSRTKFSSARSAKSLTAARSQAVAPRLPLSLNPRAFLAGLAGNTRRKWEMGKLLVVDDDPALRRLMRLELGDLYDIIDSGEPEQGLALALESKPDASLLDLRMPKYSGYELLQTLTSFSHTQRIPVIVVSGEAGGQTKEHCKQLGATGYFEKPIDFEALRACLRGVAKSRPGTSRGEVRVRLRVP